MSERDFFAGKPSEHDYLPRAGGYTLAVPRSHEPERSPAEQAEWDREVLAGTMKERARITAILTCPEAEGRYGQAKALALDESEMAPATAARLLAACPVDPKLSGRGAGAALDMSFAGGAGAYAAGQRIGERFRSGAPEAAPAGSATPQGGPAPSSGDPYAIGEAIGRRFRTNN